MGYAQEIMLRNYFVPRLKACAMSCAFAVITSIVVFVMTGNLPLSDSNFSLSDLMWIFPAFLFAHAVVYFVYIVRNYRMMSLNIFRQVIHSFLKFDGPDAPMRVELIDDLGRVIDG